MRLTLDQIKSITVGAVAVEQRDDGIHFMKCTEGQTAAWYKMSGILGDRSLSTTGIRLDFITNSKSFSLSVLKKISPSSESHFLYILRNEGWVRRRFACFFLGQGSEKLR